MHLLGVEWARPRRGEAVDRVSNVNVCAEHRQLHFCVAAVRFIAHDGCNGHGRAANRQPRGVLRRRQVVLIVEGVSSVLAILAPHTRQLV